MFAVKFQALVLSSLIASFCLLAAVGPSSFSNMSVSASPIGSDGGTVQIAAEIVDPTAVQSVSLQTRYPNGNETDTPLQLSGGNPTSGVWSSGVMIERNFSRFDQYLTLIFSSQNAAGAISRSDPFTMILEGTGSAAAQLAFTAVPSIGSSNTVSAITHAADPSSTVFVMNIQVPGLGWFTKPYCGAVDVDPIPLASDGAVTTPYATGGIDNLATTIVGYLFPANSEIPCLFGSDSIPVSFASAAVAEASVTRAPSATLPFKGFNWAIKAPSVPVGPSNNYFSANNVFVDIEGLHLRLAPCQAPDGIALCGGEVFVTKPTGYGTYTFTVSGPLSALGEDTVVGLFLYGDSSGFAHHELDCEFWRQPSDNLSAQFTVQPYTSNPPHRFAIPDGLTTASMSIAWTPSQITFSMWQGNAPSAEPSTLIAEWVYGRTSSFSDVPPNGDEEIHLNIWTQNPLGASPADAVEVVVNNVSFVPSQPSVIPFGIANAASYEAGGVAPGEILSIFGNYLGPNQPEQVQPGASGEYPTTIANSQVLFDGVPAPLLNTVDGQITVFAPFEIVGHASTVVQVSRSGKLSDPVRLAVSPFKPAVFTANQSGSGSAAILNEDGSVNAPGNPAPSGSYVSIYGTGGGQTSPPSLTGQIMGEDLSVLGEPVSVFFGGTPGIVTYAGAAPLEVGGLFQVNVSIPASAPTGPAVPLLLSIGAWTTQINTTIAVQ
jgi:uncharacterized protein (TIGR03437 family)